jgi:hypothetical protein
VFVIRSILLAVAALTLTASLSFADPGLQIFYAAGVPRVQIEGNYSNSTYTIWRAQSDLGPWTAVTNQGILCLGSCFAEDRTALPGTTYWYRFDLLLPGGVAESYGPYPVTFSRSLLRTLSGRVYPNPGRGAGTVELFLAGAANDPSVRADASLFDAQGRRVRHLFDGQLPRGLTTFRWDGRDEAGQVLRQGLYFLRVKTPGESSISRVIRAR